MSLVQQQQQQQQQQEECKCESQFRCEDYCDNYNSDPNLMRMQKCVCAKVCGPCVIGKNMRLVHEQAATLAQQDGQAQESLARQSELQAKLFILAQKYAKDTLTEENNAKRLSIELTETTQRAQIARNKMQRAVFQAQQLAQKTAQQYQKIFSSPNLININNNNNFKQNQNQLSQPYAKKQNVIGNAPESLEEAQTQAEVEISKDLQQNSLQDLQGSLF